MDWQTPLINSSFGAVAGFLSGLVAEPVKRLLSSRADARIARKVAENDTYGLLANLFGFALWSLTGYSASLSVKVIGDWIGLARAFTERVELVIRLLNFKLFDEHAKNRLIFDRIAGSREAEEIVAAVRGTIENWRRPEITDSSPASFEAWSTAVLAPANHIMDAFEQPLRLRKLDEKRLRKLGLRFMTEIVEANESLTSAQTKDFKREVQLIEEQMHRHEQALAALQRKISVP